jgi:hypothetical protein
MRFQRCHTLGWRFFAALNLVCAIAAASAAELFPYALPSQQRSAPAPSNPAAQTAVPATISDAYYEKFAARAKTLKPDQRTQLEQSFSQKREQAIKSGRVDEELHYRRLRYILDATK